MTNPSVPSIPELRKVAQPDKVLSRPNAEHWIGRRLRKISVYLTRAAISTGISANTVTGAMIVVGIGSALLFSLSGWWPLLGVLGIQLYLLLDCSDGEIARWHRTESALGVYLDRLGHYLVEAAIPVAIGLRLSNWTLNGWLTLGLAVSIGILFSKAETDLVDMARLNAGMRKMPEGATTMKTEMLVNGRKILNWLPFHRIVHAVEASFIFGVTIIIDQASSSQDWTRGALIALGASACITAIFHLLSVLNSTRLTAE